MKIFFPLIATAALLLSACGVSRAQEDNSTKDSIATIAFEDGTTISISEQDLAAVVEARKNYVDVFGELASDVDQEVQAEHLTYMVRKELLEHELEKRSITATDTDREEARKQLLTSWTQLFQETGTDRSPEEVLADENAYIDLLLGLEGLSFAAFDSLDATEYPCVSHILIGTATLNEENPITEIQYDELKVEADNVYQAVLDGQSFPEAAQQYSTDQQSALQGGSIGCQPTEIYPDGFKQAVESAEQETVIAPVKSSFGWHIIYLSGYGVEQKFQEVIAESISTTTVEIDTEVGLWNEEYRAVLPEEPEQPTLGEEPVVELEPASEQSN